jgi:hypothetical protein
MLSPPSLALCPRSEKSELGFAAPEKQGVATVVLERTSDPPVFSVMLMPARQGASGR